MNYVTGNRNGDVVESRYYLVDHDQHGYPYLHAIPGTKGVIINAQPFGKDEGVMTVQWGICGEGGTCDVTQFDIRNIDPLMVKYVTDRPTDEE